MLEDDVAFPVHRRVKMAENKEMGATGGRLTYSPQGSVLGIVTGGGNNNERAIRS